MDTQQHTPQQQENGEAENEKANYTSLPSDGPVSNADAQGKSNLQNTDPDDDAIAGDLAGNASGNEPTED
jgi:hypothetical protein